MWAFNLGTGRTGGALLVLAVVVVGTLEANSRTRVQPRSAGGDITITSPIEGTTFAPGAIVTVVVQVAKPQEFIGVVVLAGELGLSTTSSPPFTFSFTVPNNIAGPEKLTALGITTTGQDEVSQPVDINIESSALPVGISIDPPSINFKFAGQQIPVLVTATFGDGSSLDVTRSSQTTYVPDHARIVTIENNGVVTAVGSGTTNVAVGYAGRSVSVTMSVPRTIKGDLDGNGTVDRDDLNIILRSLNTPAVGPYDARDLNKDGIINGLDARILVTLCTRPGCATH